MQTLMIQPDEKFELEKRLLMLDHARACLSERRTMLAKALTDLRAPCEILKLVSDWEWASTNMKFKDGYWRALDAMTSGVAEWLDSERL